MFPSSIESQLQQLFPNKPLTTGQAIAQAAVRAKAFEFARLIYKASYPSPELIHCLTLIRAATDRACDGIARHPEVIHQPQTINSHEAIVEGHLVAIEEMIGGGTRSTLLLRSPAIPGGSYLVSNDNLDLAMIEILQHRQRPEKEEKTCFRQLPAGSCEADDDHD